VVTAASPGTARISAVSLENSSIAAYCDVTVSLTPSTVKRSFDLDIGPMARAEYSRALDRIVILDKSTDRFILIDPDDGSASSAVLPHPPLSFGLAPNGLKAAVGYKGFVSVIDMTTGDPSVVNTWPVVMNSGAGEDNGALGNVVLDQLGYIYGNDNGGGYIKVRQINSLNGAEALKNVTVDSSSYSRIHKNGTSLYSLWCGVVSVPMIRIDISDPFSETPPHYGKDGMNTFRFWYFDDGGSIIYSNGVIRSITHAEETDLLPIGDIIGEILGINVEWADHNSLAVSGESQGLIAAIPGQSNREYADRTICLIDDDDLTLKRRIYLSECASSGTRTPGRGKFCFWDDTGTELYVLVQSPDDASDWRLLVF